MKTVSSLLILSTLITLAVWGCSSANYTIHGSIRGLQDGDSIVLIHYVRWDSAGNPLVTDTIRTTVTQGTFSFSGTPTRHPTFAALRIGDRRQTSQFFIEHGPIAISGDVDSLDQLRIAGTPTNDILMAHHKREQVIYELIRPLSQQLRDSTGKTPGQAAQLQSAITEWQDSLLRIRKQFVVKNHQSHASPIYLRLIQDRMSLDSLDQLFNLLNSDVQTSLMGRQLAGRIAAKHRTAIGRIAPDFAAPDTSGTSIQLSAYRGQHVLVDFWASWCVPCRQEHPHLQTAYAKHNHQGFTIIGVSLDDKRDKWLQAVAEDHLAWPNVSLLQGFGDTIATLYGVQPIPDNFLIDPDGKIIARALRGTQLLTVLDTLLIN